MKTIIGANKGQLYGKVIILLISFCISICLSLVLYKTTNSIPTIAFFVLLSFYLFSIIMFIQILFLPIGVEIDESEKYLLLRFLLRRKLLIKESDINIYSPTQINTKSIWYDGVLIDLKDGKQLLLSNFSLKDYTPVKAFLENNNLIATEKRRFKAFWYYTNCV
jgi:hypothetical protein